MAIFWLMPLVMFLAVLPMGLCRLTNDEIIANALGSSEDLNMHYDPGKNEVKIEMDIIMTYEEYNEMFGEEENQNEDGTRKKRSAVIFNKNTTKFLWPNNRVYYQYKIGVFKFKEIKAIQAAMAEYEKYTCLKFEQNARAGNRIVFSDGNGCSSRIGMIPAYRKKPQTISLGAGCKFKGIIIHEIGHALGLFHEQSREDRDNYVIIQNHNIQKMNLDQFDKYTFGKTLVDVGVPYDYMSIMHYGKKAFTRRGGITVYTKDQRYQDLIGQLALSFYDIKTMNLLYKCPRDSRCRIDHKHCPHEGFVGKDCTCWCKGAINENNDNPVVKCSDKYGIKATPQPTMPPTPRPTPSPKPSECQDIHTSCAPWAAKGECESNPDYMLTACKKSCKKCNDCQDLNASCAPWAAKGECESNPKYMLKMCRKSCTKCNGGACQDLHKSCPGWAAKGECASNPGFMLASCKKSCNACEDCKDANPSCPAWAAKGECTKNPVYMLASCKKSCNSC